MEAKKVENSILIAASPERVWEVLTAPEHTAKYMFGCGAESDWEVGSPLLWRGEYEGLSQVFVQGFVLHCQPPRSLQYSVIDPQANYPLSPGNHLRVTYALKPAEAKQTRLTVTQDGFETAAEGEKRYLEVYNEGAGWDPILVAIKATAEA